MEPKISVLMPVYNGENFLRIAIDSILNQTFSDFEFLIINDASTDKSLEIIRSLTDPRVRLISNEKNLGLVGSLNVGIKEARGKYIARMDQDDISLPARLARQYAFMEDNPEIGLAGSWVKVIGKKKSFISRYPVRHEELAAYSLFATPFAHPAVIMRKSVLDANHLSYSSLYRKAEDIELWSRALKVTKFANLPEVLLHYRRHDDNMSNRKPDERNDTATQIKLQLLAGLKLEPTEEELKIHGAFYQLTNLDEKGLDVFEAWLGQIARANEGAAIYNQKALASILAERWLLLCHINSRLGFKSWKKFWQSRLSRQLDMKKERLALLKFFFRCLVRR